ncbi:MAG: hypothetical protein EP344_12365, partial [Bacteroidetes bacterium]
MYHYLPSVRCTALLLFAFFTSPLAAQPTIAREWSEALHLSMQEDLARPAVQARNLFHFSLALYDAWAAYDPEADPYLLGQTVEGYRCPFSGVPVPEDVEAAQREAMSFAAYRLLTARFTHSPKSTGATFRFRELMEKHGYDTRNYAIDYASGSPAALGNYIAQCIMQMGYRDGANERNNYLDPEYQPGNPALDLSGASPEKEQDPNRWQPLNLNRPIDLDGYAMVECRCGGQPLATYIGSVDPTGRHVTGTQTCQTPHWSLVQPFALIKPTMKVQQRDGHEYRLYHDPGNDFLPHLDPVNGSGTSMDYAWSFALVAAWSGLSDPTDGVQWDISPGSMGNVEQYPKNLSELRDFYHLQTGRDAGAG